MIGTLVNVGAIAAGSLIGVALKKGISEEISGSVVKVQGVVIAIISLNGIISAMFRVDADGVPVASGGLLLLVAMVAGCAIGELLRIEARINTFGQKVEARFGAAGFAKGFVAASLIFPVGAMAVIGSLYDGLQGDSSILFIKSTLDFVISIVLASTLGIGVLFSFIPVFLLQGSITLLAELINPFVTDALLDLIGMTGYAIVLCIGINFFADAKIRVANLLPALVIPVVYYFVFGSYS